MGSTRTLNFSTIFFRIVFIFCFISVLIWPVNCVRPLRQRSKSWGDEWVLVKEEEHDYGPFSSWNITGTYRGDWKFLDSANTSSKFRDFENANGYSELELFSTPTKITGVHYVQGVIVFRDEFDNEHYGGSQIKVAGVYVWPFRQLRLVLNSAKENGVLLPDGNYMLTDTYHVIGVFSSQVLQESREKTQKRKHNPIYDMEKHCNIEIVAQISRSSPRQNDGDREKYHLEGVLESPSSEDGEVNCFPPVLLNATSINTDVYNNKAINYTLMVTFISFLQVLMFIRQMEYSNTQSGAAKVSLLMVGHMAILDAYFCLLHLTAGIIVDSLFNAFATASFFKFVVFSIFEMRYLVIIWKAHRPHMNNGDNWDIMRRELSALYSRLYGILLGGIIVMFEFHQYLRFILLLLHSYWIPQIVTNVVRDSRKPLHPYFIIGMSITRMAVPLYIYGCPHNFARMEPDNNWCVCLVVFMGIQVFVLLVQHYFGARWFIPRHILPDKYSYYRRADRGSNNAIDCVICMMPIDLGPRSSDCMVTPCEHFFHSSCLHKWMDVKMECPTCRRSLPPA